MRHDGNYRRAALLGAAALAAGLLAGATSAGTVLASTAPGSTAPGSTAPGSTVLARSTAGYQLSALATGIKALGHTWSLEVYAANSSVQLEFWTHNRGHSENYLWSSYPSFARTAAKDLTVASTAHATFKTGGALSPVLAVSLRFTPAKRIKHSCAKGSSTTYTGYATGTVKLVTGLRGVKVSLKFSKKSRDAYLLVDKSCIPPTPKATCNGDDWSVPSASYTGWAAGAETPGTKPPWDESFVQPQAKTASKWLSRLDLVDQAGGRAPKLNTAARTVAIAASGAITGSAVISYTHVSAGPAINCYLHGKRYAETFTDYTGGVKVTKPFRTHAVLTGTLTLTPAKSAIYTAVSLKAR